MPLTRYQIRTEYGLADPELYKAADKDDPEALLEGVAMAGLVGVLRQLGDLAEFAAEVFHDLHEEVISTAARGHSLMIRVQQLEAEVPSIEKAFLSQTNHTSFFTSAGLDWHPNLQSEQSLVARGDLPRFVMDSYEECRGPPRLFLLDKFDVAGAGACLKRYTDPSVFKVERSNIEPHREKKIRKVKKKGPRWRNGGTPEIGPTSHTKLHQLFLEERIESCFNDPSRLVKLKKRQFNGCITSKNGKSYMEKFLEAPSPEHKMVYEASVAAPTLHSMLDNTNELGLRILDITTVSPASKSPGRLSTCSSCLAQEEELKRPINGNVSGDEIFKMPESTADDEFETTSNLQLVVVENPLEYGEGKTGSSIDGYRSDEVISEVDNYVDALATMESEIETDNEPRCKTVNLGRQRSESDANDEHLEIQAQLSDSQSFVNSSGSDDGISSFKRERSSFSCSDTVSSLIDNIQYDSEETAKVLPSIPKACMVDIANMPYGTDYTSHSHESNADEHGVLDDTSVDEERVSKSEVPGDSRFLDSISPQPLLDSELCSSPSLLVEPKMYKKPSTDLVNSLQTSSTVTDLGCDKDVHLDVPSKAVGSANYTIPFEGYHVRDREGVDVDATSDNSLHLSNVLGQAVESQAVEKVVDTMLQKDYIDDRTIDKQEIELSPSSLLSSETSRVSTNDSSDNKYNAIALKGEDDIVAAEAKYEDLPPAVDSQTKDLKDDNIVAGAKYEDLPLATDFSQTQDLKDQVENVADDVLLVENGTMKTNVTYSVRDANVVDITSADDDGNVTIFIHADDTSEEQKLCYPNVAVPEHLNSRDFVETVHPEGATLPSTSVSSHDEITSPGDLDHKASVNYSNFATVKVQADEVVDSGNCSDIVTKKGPADEVVNPVNYSEIVTEKVQADEVVDSVACSDNVSEKVRSEQVVDFFNRSDVMVQVDEIVVQGDDVGASTSVIAKTATVPEVIPNNLYHSSDEENVSVDKLPTGVHQPDGFAFDADPTTSNDANEFVSTSLNDILSTSGNMKSGLLENHLGLENSYPNQNEFKDASVYSGNKLNHVEVATAPLDSKDESISGYPDSVVDDLSFGPKSLELRNLESKPNSSHQSDLKEGIELISPPPPCFSSVIETSRGPSPGLQAKHKQMELVQADVDVSNSLLLEQRSPSKLHEEKVELAQSSDPVQQDQISKCKASEASIQTGHSLSELYRQHPIGEDNATGCITDTLQPVLPSYILLPEVPQVSLNEMPPLPPLPPMQWRLGKIQQAFPAPPRSEDPLQSYLESSIAAPLQPENPYTCFQDNKLTNISGNTAHNTMQPPPFSLQSPMINNENFEYSSTTMEKQYNNPFISSPPMPKETPEHDSIKSDGEKVQSDLKLPSLGPTNDDVNCKSDLGSSCEQSFQPFTYSAPDIVLKPDKPQHASQDFEGGQRNSHAMMESPSLMKNEQSWDALPTTEEEVASSSNTALVPSTSGVGMPNGNPPTSSKLLRPRSPLIDAVAAHDKSKLRKVSDRILPEIGPKVDERDSLLAQIRTKSFSLKPAVVSRPSIQGPKTNLRVAAILEKANAIRQAFAGSDDEDDDSDNWSDSE